MRLLARVSIGIIVCIFCNSELLNSQSIWTCKKGESMITLEYLHPSLQQKWFGSDVTTNTFILSGKFKLRSGHIIKVELPYTMLHADGFTYSFGYGYSLYSPEINSKTVGNIYTGIEMPIGGNNSIDLGIRFPTTSSKEVAVSFGAFADYDRFEAFLPDYMSVNAIFNFANDPLNLFALRFRLGPTACFYTESQESVDSFEMFFGSSLQLGVQSEKFDFLMGYSGRFVMTAEGDLSDRLIHQFGVSGNAHIGNFHPGIYYKIPLSKNLESVLTGVLGISLGVEL